MAALSTADLRTLISARLSAYVDAHQNQPGYKAPPEQLIESMVMLETGGVPDPAFTDPMSGAIGLGQITLDGSEWSDWRANHPDADASKLTDGAYNLDVMIAGLAQRQSDGDLLQNQGETGAYADWYMAAAGYLGGASEDGFNGQPDAYGTTGQDYIRRVRAYIVATWDQQTADDIDGLYKGAAVAAGGDWANGAITYDPNAPAAEQHATLLDRLLKKVGSGLAVPGDLIDKGKDALTSVPAAIVDGAKTLAVALAVVALVVVVGFATAKAVGLSPENAVPIVAGAKKAAAVAA